MARAQTSEKKSKAPSRSKTAKTERKSAKSSKDTDEPRKRYFKVINRDTLETVGRYVGQTPKQASNKGYSKYIKRALKNGERVPKKTEIFIRESTQGSAKKTYGYLCQRDKLDKPQIVKIVDPKTNKKKKIVYKYRNKTHKIPVPEELINHRSKAAKKASQSKTNKKKKSTKNTKTAKKTTRNNKAGK